MCKHDTCVKLKGESDIRQKLWNYYCVSFTAIYILIDVLQLDIRYLARSYIKLYTGGIL